MGWAASISEAHVGSSVTHIHSGVSYTVQPGLGKVFENYATSNLMTCPIMLYSPLGITETLKTSPCKCGGGKEGGKKGGEGGKVQRQ